MSTTTDEARQRAFEFLQKYLNSSKRETKSTNVKEPPKPEEKDEPKVDDDWLTKWVENEIVSKKNRKIFISCNRKAIQELQREICINKVKRKAFGSVTAPKSRANKRFLATTLNQCLSHNNREITKHQSKSENKLVELDRAKRLKSSKAKFGERKHEYTKPEKKKKRRRRRSSSSSSSSSNDWDTNVLKWIC